MDDLVNLKGCLWSRTKLICECRFFFSEASELAVWLLVMDGYIERLPSLIWEKKGDGKEEEERGKGEKKTKEKKR